MYVVIVEAIADAGDVVVVAVAVVAVVVVAVVVVAAVAVAVVAVVVDNVLSSDEEVTSV